MNETSPERRVASQLETQKQPSFIKELYWPDEEFLPKKPPVRVPKPSPPKVKVRTE